MLRATQINKKSNFVKRNPRLYREKEKLKRKEKQNIKRYEFQLPDK